MMISSNVEQSVYPPVHCPDGFRHIICEGDTFYKLAKKYGTTMEAIMDANPGVDPMDLQIGQVICIPKHKPPFCPGGTIYVVRHGDTCHSIVKRYNISIGRLAAANPGINLDKLYAGQRICIPVPPHPYPPHPDRRYCSMLLRATPKVFVPDCGGVVWCCREESGWSHIVIVCVGIPEHSGTGYPDRYTARMCWESDSLDIPLMQTRGVPGVWLGMSHQMYPEELFSTGYVEINPGPVMSGSFDECRQ